MHSSLSELAHSTRAVFNKAAKAYFTHDAHLANTAIEESTVLVADIKRYELTIETSWVNSGGNLVKSDFRSFKSVIQIMNLLIQISNYCSTLGEVTINISFEKCDNCRVEESSCVPSEEQLISIS